MLSFPAFLCGVTSIKDDSLARRRLNKEFMEAMHKNPHITETRKKGRELKLRKLHDKLMKASRRLADSSYTQYNQNSYQQSSYQAQQQGDQQQNDAYSDVGTWNGQNWQFNGEVPFDLTSRAFKYSGCAAIKSYDETRAYETGNPMVIDTYAVFRLCPADQCNKYSTTGCGKNYGEYAVEMKTYLSYILGFYDERFNDYCEYCEPCDWEYQASAKTDLQLCYANQEQKQYQQAVEAQQQAWQNFYNANNGDMSGWNVNNENWNGGDANFQNYNNYYNQARNYNGYYNNDSNGAGANYNANSNSANGGSYGSSYDMGSYQNSNGNYRSGYGNRQLQNGYFDEDGNWVDGNNNDGNDSNSNYYSRYSYADYASNGGNNAQNNYGNGGNGYVNGYWGADGKFYQTDNGNNNNNNNNGNNNNYYTTYQEYEGQICNDGSICDQCEYENEEMYGWCDDYICGDYYTYCSDLYGETSNFDVSQYLECTEYQASNGFTYYIAPHCGSDHFTISLGVFSDENCLEYIGEDVSLANVLGFKYNDGDLFQFPKECISCDGTVS